jgi:hypothetical protein
MSLLRPMQDFSNHHPAFVSHLTPIIYSMSDRPSVVPCRTAAQALMLKQPLQNYLHSDQIIHVHRIRQINEPVVSLEC